MTHSDEHLKELETLVIHIAHPRGNVQHGRFARSLNLRLQFKKMLTQKVKGIFASGKSVKVESQKMSAKVKLGEKNSHWKKIPPLQGLLPASTQLKAVYKGIEYLAVVDDNGRINLAGELYNSPSSAGFQIARRPNDGWHLWRFQWQDGKWMVIDELRKKAGVASK